MGRPPLSPPAPISPSPPSYPTRLLSETLHTAPNATSEGRQGPSPRSPKVASFPGPSSERQNKSESAPINRPVDSRSPRSYKNICYLRRFLCNRLTDGAPLCFWQADLVCTLLLPAPRPGMWARRRTRVETPRRPGEVLDKCTMSRNDLRTTSHSDFGNLIRGSHFCSLNVICSEIINLKVLSDRPIEQTFKDMVPSSPQGTVEYGDYDDRGLVWLPSRSDALKPPS
uniref:Uncharacterized protein n=1 Tax=Steinernema glaseri TaxID=37863 RepID=A0A1I7Z8N3_9BILA